MCSEKRYESIAKAFENTLLDTNRGFNYYVDWSNINGYKDYDIEIHAMDALIGKNDGEFFEIFKTLIVKLPTIIEVFPFLFALSKSEQNKVRKNRTLKIIGNAIDSDDFKTYSFNSKKLQLPLTSETIQMYYEFFKQMGLKNLYQNLIEKSTQDYIVGVLVGSDSNGRKNRGGTAFELACEPIIKTVCQKYNVEVIAQKKFEILKQYGFSISDDIANRKADFILLKRETKICMNIEVNFFNGGGSKPEEIIDSYINRQADLLDNKIKFALITDGNCWKGTTNQLQKGFRHLNYLMNFNLAKSGMLEKIISKEFGEM
ncbi:MAG: type II restriction endonuclease [Clostridia bacterium]|nr:type II restriction endonuclease [Clostridia bacterium]